MQISFWQLPSEQVKESGHGAEMTMENKRNLFGRRQYIVDKRSQIYLAVLLVFYLVIYSLALLVIILGPSALVFTSEITLLLAVHFILITHRLFGPLFRFRRVLRQWGEGEWPRPFKARPKDFHQEVFEDFNKATVSLKGDFGQVRAEISAALAGLQKMESSTAQPEQACQLKNIGQSCQAACAILDKYGL